MKTSIPLILLLIFSSCQKKEEPRAVQQVQRNDNYVPPAAEDAIDTTQSYISPLDVLSDHSRIVSADFRSQTTKFRGTRNIFYHTSQNRSGDISFVIEYLAGIKRNGDTTSTASRILVYTDGELAYRKAFPVEFTGALNFSSVQKFDHAILPVSAVKSIIYYWMDVETNGAVTRLYRAIAVDKDGLTNEMSGDLTRIGGNISTLRFLNENRMRARISPNGRYPNLMIDLIFSIDWKLCSADLDVPEDTIFSVSEQPSRFFNGKIKLHEQPSGDSRSRETNFRRLTQAQMQRLFVPSFFNPDDIRRDFLYIDFNRTTRGWIDYNTMAFEEIVSEN